MLYAEAAAFAADDIGAAAAGVLEQPPGHGLGEGCDQQDPLVVSRLGRGLEVLDHSGEVGGLHDQGRDVVRDLIEVGTAVQENTTFMLLSKK